jgi:hypothetical protein
LNAVRAAQSRTTMIRFGGTGWIGTALVRRSADARAAAVARNRSAGKITVAVGAGARVAGTGAMWTLPGWPAAARATPLR